MMHKDPKMPEPKAAKKPVKKEYNQADKGRRLAELMRRMPNQKDDT
jgi:hypothetical protein|tara:strand:- start:509 stop:646 length:138 start_codon:yes stop_codon:yes gene_type:complete